MRLNHVSFQTRVLICPPSRQSKPENVLSRFRSPTNYLIGHVFTANAAFVFRKTMRFPVGDLLDDMRVRIALPPIPTATFMTAE
jgi:hypothetical protein